MEGFAIDFHVGPDVLEVSFFVEQVDRPAEKDVFRLWLLEFAQSTVNAPCRDVMRVIFGAARDIVGFRCLLFRQMVITPSQQLKF